MAKTYVIKRFFQREEVPTRTIKRGLSLAEARAWCNDPQTSSATATRETAVALAERLGPWFDGYEEEQAERHVG